MIGSDRNHQVYGNILMKTDKYFDQGFNDIKALMIKALMI